VFTICLLVLLRTMVPTLWRLDSAELAAGAATLGIVHAPGYPLYLVAAHLFTLLPIGDIAYRVNLFSVLCLALTAPILYTFIAELIEDSLIALTTTLVFMWSYYIWSSGIAAEVYALQLLTLSACAYRLVLIYRRRQASRAAAALMGLLVGAAVSAAPSSILFIPGVAVAFRSLKISWRRSIFAAMISLLTFAAALSYFPIRYASHPALNMAGDYAADGTFRGVDLQTANGVWWIVSGAQFRGLFFVDGFLPTSEQLLKTLSWFWGNYLGLGLVLGIIGGHVLWVKQRGLLLTWLVFFLPYTYFYLTYGAPDRDTMFGPSYLLWAILIAFGLKWATESASRRAKLVILHILPTVIFVVNFPLLDASHYTDVRDRSEVVLHAMPVNAEVFGSWWDIVPLQYLSFVENERPDLQLYNTFQFYGPAFSAYLDAHTDDSQQASLRPIILLGSALQYLDTTRYRAVRLDINDPSGNTGSVSRIEVYRVLRRGLGQTAPDQ
jgi:hypothetical protein